MEQNRLSFLIGTLTILVLMVISASSAQTETKTVTFYNTPEESGTVCNDKSLGPEIMVGSDNRVMYQALLSFDVSSIPKGSIIKDVAIDLSNNQIIGNPLEKGACLKIYPASYIKFNSNRYKICSQDKPVITKCSDEDLSEPINDLLLKIEFKKKVGKKFQLRMNIDGGPKPSPEPCPSPEWDKIIGSGSLEGSSFGVIENSNKDNEIYFDDIGLIVTFIPPSGDAP